MSEYFQRVANDVLKASEELSVVLEDGISAMMKGSAAAKAGEGEAMPGEGAGAEFEEEDFEGMIEEELMHSPLQGMAESVLRPIAPTPAIAIRLWDSP